MAQCSSNTFFTTIVESYNTTVAQRQLKLALTLLACNLTCYRAVYLVGQPVFTSYCFQLQYAAYVFVQFSRVVRNIFVMTFYSLVYHVSLRRRTEHLVYCQVERTYTVSLFESKTMVTGCFTYHVHRSAFTFCNLLYMFDGFFVDKQAHTFLRFVGNDFFCRQSFIADRQLIHMNQSTTVFHQLRQTVYVSC